MLKPETLQEIVRQSPIIVATAGALIAVVWIFIKFLEGQMRENRNFYKILNDSHLEARALQHQALAENTAALKENIQVTTRNTSQIEQLSRMVDHMDRNR